MYDLHQKNVDQYHRDQKKIRQNRNENTVWHKLAIFRIDDEVRRCRLRRFEHIEWMESGYLDQALHIFENRRKIITKNTNPE